MVRHRQRGRPPQFPAPVDCLGHGKGRLACPQPRRCVYLWRLTRSLSHARIARATRRSRRRPPPARWQWLTRLSHQKRDMPPCHLAMGHGMAIKLRIGARLLGLLAPAADLFGKAQELSWHRLEVVKPRQMNVHSLRRFAHGHASIARPNAIHAHGECALGRNVSFARWFRAATPRTGELLRCKCGASIGQYRRDVAIGRNTARPRPRPLPHRRDGHESRTDPHGARARGRPGGGRQIR